MLTSDNTLKLKLKKGHPVIGTWSIISSPVVVEILALSGFDFLILDMEHGIYDITSLDSCIRACEVAGCSPIVRVPGMCPSAIQSSLDLGAHGIIVPQIDGLCHSGIGNSVECSFISAIQCWIKHAVCRPGRIVAIALQF